MKTSCKLICHNFVNPVFYQYGSSHAASSKYGNTASIYQRRNEFTDKHVYYDGNYAEHKYAQKNESVLISFTK